MNETQIDCKMNAAAAIAISLFLLTFCGGGIAALCIRKKALILKNKQKHIADAQATHKKRIACLTGRHRQVAERQAELQKAASRLSASNATKTELFKNISHDLRQPLVHLRQKLAGLMIKISEEQFRSAVMQLTVTVSNISLLLENLLLWSKYQAQGICANPQYISIGGLIGGVIEQVRFAAADRQITLRCAAASQLVVFADEEMVQTVLKVFIQNIIRLSMPGAAIYIAGSVGQQSGCLKINWEGQMPMMPTLIRLAINPAYRPEAPDTEKAMAVAWMLCHALMEACGGKICIETDTQGALHAIFSFPLGMQESASA